MMWEKKLSGLLLANGLSLALNALRVWEKANFYPVRKPYFLVSRKGKALELVLSNGVYRV